MPLRSRDMCYLRSYYLPVINLYETTRFDFPVLAFDNAAISSEQIDYDMFNFIYKTNTYLRVYDNKHYLIRLLRMEFGEERTRFGIYLDHNTRHYGSCKYIKSIYKDELTADVKWADLGIDL